MIRKAITVEQDAELVQAAGDVIAAKDACSQVDSCSLYWE